jgi:multimeric flavodoxin WrbA
MKRLALNGSPRGVYSNSRKILSWIFEGMREAGADAPPILDLARVEELEYQRKAFLEAEEVLLVFPLYTDSVPGVVKGFIDSLDGADPRLLEGKRFCFVVHSGFPESMQSEAVTRYLTRLCARMGMILLGSAVKGTSEGFRMMPDNLTGKTRAWFAAIGRSLVREGKFDEEAVGMLARPYRLTLPGKILFVLLSIANLHNMYWNVMLKKHGGWNRRFDRPYAKELALSE